VRYCKYAVDEDNGSQYPGGEYEGKQDVMGMMLMRRRMVGRTQLARMTASKIRRIQWRVRHNG